MEKFQKNLLEPTKTDLKNLFLKSGRLTGWMFNLRQQRNTQVQYIPLTTSTSVKDSSKNEKNDFENLTAERVGMILKFRAGDLVRSADKKSILSESDITYWS